MLKGVTEINNYLTEWFTNHGFEVEAEMGDEFAVNLNDNTLFWAPYYNEDNAEIYLEEVQKDFPDLECNDVIFGFFHEIGHVETEDLWTAKEWEEYDEFVSLCENIRDYFRHPIEWAATKWACEYILEHEEEIEQFWQDLVKLIKNFYDLNDVEY